MILKLKRIYKGITYSIGKLYINGEYFCDTLEDVDRGLFNDMNIDEIKRKKIYGKTAIPVGVYQIIISYSPRFNKNLPLLLQVKGYEGIRIHAGNSADDTDGCILVGENKIKGKVINSRNIMKKLMTILNSVNEKIIIQIE